MLLSLASGLYLWWPMKQIRIRGKWGDRQLWLDLHNAIGIFLLLPLVMLAATGTALGFEEQLAPLIYKLTRSTPNNTTRAPVREPEPGATPITPDEAVAIARIQMPGAEAYRVQMPKYGGLYVVALRYPQDRITGGANQVVLDSYHGNVVSLSRASDLTSGDRILATIEAIHTGSIWGMPSRIVVWVASTMVLVQASSGLFLWLYPCRITPTPAPSTEESVL
jgi:uncharacterized iron-regulated membrane protein